jgi:hypothetical protein
MDTVSARPKFRDVTEFAAWFASQPLARLVPFMRADSINYGPIGRAVLFRDREFQAELWIVWPGETAFPEHLHPDVDTVEIHLSGDLTFTLNGSEVASNIELTLADGSTFPALRIRESDAHQASAGVAGAMFLSCQRWLHDVPPASVALNWQGPEFSSTQRELRATGASTSK